MAYRFKTGVRSQVIASMAEYAIRDQQALIDAHIPRYGQPSDTAKEVIAKCRDRIADYRRIAARATKGDTP